jgi:pyruvate dehydrogenase E1 component
MYYREDKNGQILQEGINEAGGMSSWIAAATSYSTNNRIMVPFYIYYSMFGFQRIGDLAWAAGDMQARGFLLGGTSGRTTLNGEGLQHEDGHSHILAGTIPNCISYDPTFAHEVAVILHHGLKRMVEKQDNVFFYLTLLNENYPMPGLKPGTEEQIIKGMYLLEEGAKKTPRVNLLGSGTILREARRPGSCWRPTGAWPPTSGAAPASTNWRATARTASAGTCCTRPRQPRVPFVAAAAGGACRPGGGQHRLHEELRRADPRLHPQGARATRCWAPTASAAAISAASCASTSRSTATTSWWPRSRPWPTKARLPAAKVAEAIKKYGIDADASTRCTPEPANNGDTDMALVEVKVPDIGDFKDVESSN